MMRFRKMGVMCINGEIQGVCQHCLWLEWNPELKKCTNCNLGFCPKREEEESADSEAEARFFSLNLFRYLTGTAGAEGGS